MRMQPGHYSNCGWHRLLSPSLPRKCELSERREQVLRAKCTIFSLPITALGYVSRGAVSRPTVELGRVFQLLTAGEADDEELRANFRQGSDVAPQLLELRDRIDVLLTVPPSLLHVLERAVRRNPTTQRTDCMIDSR